MLDRQEENFAWLNQEVTIIKSIYLIILTFYTMSRKKSPPHMMWRYSIYECKTRELIISVNKIRACISYKEVQETQQDLTNYHFISTAKHILKPSHLPPDQVILVAFDSFSHSHQSSSSSTLSNHDTIMTFFQIKPHNLPFKPSKKSLYIYNTALKDKRFCHTLQKYVGARINLSTLAQITQPIS